MLRGILVPIMLALIQSFCQLIPEHILKSYAKRRNIENTFEHMGGLSQAQSHTKSTARDLDLKNSLIIQIVLLHWAVVLLWALGCQLNQPGLPWSAKHWG